MHAVWLGLLLLSALDRLHPGPPHEAAQRFLAPSVISTSSKQAIPSPAKPSPIPSMKDGTELPPLPDPVKPDYKYDELPKKKPDQVEPQYPADSIAANEQGRVILHVYLDSFGDVIDVKIHRSSGHKRLDEAALAAVRQWHYTPARRSGFATPSEILVPIRFVIKESA